MITIDKQLELLRELADEHAKVSFKVEDDHGITLVFNNYVDIHLGHFGENQWDVDIDEGYDGKVDI